MGTFHGTMDFKKLRSRLLTIARLNAQSPISVNSDIAMEREEILNIMIHSIREQIANLPKGNITTNVCWNVPNIRGLHSSGKLLETTAQRIAWELFPEQIDKRYQGYVLGIENDPFFNTHKTYKPSDTEQLAIETGKASAEVKYRRILQDLRACYG
jgi:hypothetical protein